MKTLRMMVCPHDSASHPERWFELAQYLSRGLHDARVVFEPSLGFDDFHRDMGEADLLYANPQDTFDLHLRDGFLLLARASNLFDEVVIVANGRASEARSGQPLEALKGRPVATVPSMLPTRLALEHLAKVGITPGRILAKDSWLAVMNAVVREEAPFGFVYRDFFAGLRGLSRRMVRLLDQTGDGSIHHSFVLNPCQRDYRDAIAEMLLGMGETAPGRSVLEALGMRSLVAVDQTIISNVGRLVDSFEIAV